MPLFEYKCAECDNLFEELVTSGEVKVYCPKCKSEKVSRLLSVFSASGGTSSSRTSGLPCGKPSCGSGFS